MLKSTQKSSNFEIRLRLRHSRGYGMCGNEIKPYKHWHLWAFISTAMYPAILCVMIWHLMILVRARTCVPVRAWPYVQKKKIFQTACHIQQPHKPFLHSRVPVRAWPYVQKKKKSFKPRARNNNHTSRSFTLAWPYVQKKPKNFQTTTQAIPSLS